MLGLRVVLISFLGFKFCHGLDFTDVLEKALEFEEELGADFRNSHCFRDFKDLLTTLTTNGSDKMWALKCKC